MKSIVYLSIDGDRPCKPILIDHDPRLAAFEHYIHHDPRHTGSLYQWRYVCSIDTGMGIHEKINRRAEEISRTASIRVFHGRKAPPCWDDKRPVGRDYQWYVTPERIAKSRFRKAKRDARTGRKHTYGALGYAIIDFSFGLTRPFDNLNSWERQAVGARLDLASTSRAPLPPWSLNSAVDEILKQSAA